MSVQLITKEDLQLFKNELITEIKTILSNNSPQQKKWLKSWEVREILGISRGTLQTMRDNGTLQATPVGGLMFYDYEDIAKLMQNKKPQRR